MPKRVRLTLRGQIALAENKGRSLRCVSVTDELDAGNVMSFLFETFDSVTDRQTPLAPPLSCLRDRGSRLSQPAV